MSEDLVLVNIDTVTTIRLNNPPLNLVTSELTQALNDVLTEIEGRDEVRAVVVTGEGERAFCAGSDITEFEKLRGRVAEGKLLMERHTYRRLAKLRMPNIAAIEGDALGGGLELAMCCDLRVASVNAKLGLPEVRLGVIPGSGGTQRLARLVGLGKAKELILTGELIDAEEAERIGLVNRVVPQGEAEATATEIATTIGTRGPLAVREVKRLLDLSVNTPLEEGLAAELDASERVFNTEDMMEGARAFFEKRPPDFEGK